MTAVSMALADMATIARRDLLRVRRQPELLTFGVTMGVFFLLLFNYVFGGSISAGTGVDYTQYVVPGVLVLTALLGAQQTGIGLAEDLTRGVTDRFRSLPMSQSAVVGGRTLSDAVRNTVAVLLVVPVGYLLGFRFDNLPGALGALIIAIGMGFAFSWVNAAIAVAIGNLEAVQMASMFWFLPLMFASSIFSPTDPMPGWLQGFAENQPISVAADAARALSSGSPVGDLVWRSIAWIVGLSVVFGMLATRLYRRRA